MRVSAHHREKKGDLFDIKEFSKTTKCNICGCTSFKKLMKSADKEELHFVKCEHCSAVTYNYVPTAEVQEKIYNNYDYWGAVESEEKQGKYTFSGQNRFAKHLLKILNVEEKSLLKILDFGGGDGSLAKTFAEYLINSAGIEKIEIDVVDYGDEIAESDERIRLDKFFPLGSVRDDQSYDVIIASAVMEHIDNPKDSFDIVFTT